MKLLKSVDPECFENQTAKNVNTRKVKAETKIRSQFISKGSRKFPKKEYIRCKLIRGHKRVLRQIMLKELSQQDLQDSTMHPSSRQYYWNLLIGSFTQNRETFSEIIPVEMGPVNEIMKRKKMKTDHLKRSFNAEFCKDYLMKPETRESYFYYIEFLFSDFDCENFIKRFGFKCCANGEHKSECYMKWLLLKKYCSSLVLEDINVTPFQGEGKNLPLPSLVELQG